jgi:hypothetical protein
MEVFAVAGQSGKANDSPEPRVRCRVVTDMKPKVVERRIVDIPPQLAVTLGHIEGRP